MWEANLTGQTQPTPALIAFRILSALGLVRSGLRDYARGYHVYKDIWEASSGEQLLCQCENGNHANLLTCCDGCREVTSGSSMLNESTRPVHFLNSLYGVSCWFCMGALCYDAVHVRRWSEVRNMISSILAALLIHRRYVVYPHVADITQRFFNIKHLRWTIDLCCLK